MRADREHQPEGFHKHGGSYKTNPGAASRQHGKCRNRQKPARQ